MNHMPVDVGEASDPAVVTKGELLVVDAQLVLAAVQRLSKRHRVLLQDEIAHTLSDPAMGDEEMRALFGAFAT